MTDDEDVSSGQDDVPAASPKTPQKNPTWGGATRALLEDWHFRSRERSSGTKSRLSRHEDGTSS